MGRTRCAADAAGWRFFSGWGFATAPSLALAELGHLLHILIADKLHGPTPTIPTQSDEPIVILRRNIEGSGASVAGGRFRPISDGTTPRKHEGAERQS